MLSDLLGVAALYGTLRLYTAVQVVLDISQTIN